MPFQLKTHEPNKLVFERSPLGCFHLALVFVGAGIILVSVYVISLTDAELVFMAIPLCFGLVFLLAGTSLVPRIHRNTPQTIEFDHEKASLCVRMQNGQSANIPYRDIQGFEIVFRTQSNYESKSKYPMVVMKKKDGGWWDIATKNANKTLALLQEIPLEKESDEIPSGLLSKNIQTHESPHKSLIAWRNKFSVAHLIIFLFALIIGSFGFQATKDNWLAAIPIVLVSGAMVWLVFKIVQMHFSRLAVSIDSHSLDYYQFSLINKKKIKSVGLPINDIVKVMYIFSPDSQGTSRFWLMTPGDLEYAKEHATDHVQVLIDQLTNRRQPLIIQIDSINPVECLQLENWLQNKLRQYGNTQSDL